MSRGGWRRLQWAAAALSVAIYAVLSHYCNVMADAHGLGTALAMAPMTAVALTLAWRCTPPPVAALLTVALAGALYGCWPLLKQHFRLLYLLQDSGVYCLLGLTFGRSLMPGRLALCTHLADKVHGPLSQQEVRYTRQVTAAWTTFFFAVAVISVLLFVLAPLRIWSAYINFGIMPLVGAMFIAEQWVRQRVLPRGQRAGLLATVRVYFTTPQRS